MKRLLVLIAFLVVQNAMAQRIKDVDLKKINIEQVIENMSEVLIEHYLFPDTATKMVDHFKALLASGELSKTETAKGLARKLSSEFDENFLDTHMRVIYNPREAKRLNRDVLDETGIEYSQAEIDALLAIEIHNNYRFPAVKKLPGNIGYLRLDSFLPPEYAKGYEERIASIFELISDTDALILDVGHNPGGYGEGVDLLLSYFLPDKTKFIESIARIPGGGIKTVLGYTWDKVKGEQYLDKPVYILTSGRSASAAESFAHALKYSNRAEVIGKRTYGAGYLGGDFAIDDNFIMWVSYASGKHPNAEKDWEGIGVSPDIDVRYGESLYVAQIRALEKLIAIEERKSKNERVDFKLEDWKWQLDRVKALKGNLKLSQEEMEKVVGGYGSRRVEIIDGELYYYRINPDRPYRKMIPDGNGGFYFKEWDDYKVSFPVNEDGVVDKIRMRSPTRLLIFEKN